MLRYLKHCISNTLNVNPTLVIRGSFVQRQKDCKLPSEPAKRPCTLSPDPERPSQLQAVNSIQRLWANWLDPHSQFGMALLRDFTTKTTGS